MEDWSKDFFAMVESVTEEFQQFFQDVSEMVEMAADDFHDNVATEIELCLQELFEPIIEIYTEFEDINESEASITYKVEPTWERNPACRGCGNYHGYMYGGNLLVCGMHPYGWDDENCPDWEAKHPPSSHLFDEDLENLFF